jgi:hypothetical protein
MHLVHDIKEHDIPTELHVNMDQARGVYAQGCNFTWAQTGSKQVSVVGAEEKRVMTIVVSVSSSGVLLPFQAVYEGKSSVSCPKNQQISTLKQLRQASISSIQATKLTGQHRKP